MLISGNTRMLFRIRAAPGPALSDSKDKIDRSLYVILPEFDKTGQAVESTVVGSYVGRPAITRCPTDRSTAVAPKSSLWIGNTTIVAVRTDGRYPPCQGIGRATLGRWSRVSVEELSPRRLQFGLGLA